MNFYKAPSKNFVQLNLDGSINSSQQTITLNSVADLQAPGAIIVDRVDANGLSTPALREVITFTGISGSTITGCTRGVDGTVAQSHSDLARVDTVLTVGAYNDLVGIVSTALDVTGTKLLVSTATITGTLNVSGASIVGFNASNITATNAIISTATITNAVITNSVNVSGASVVGIIQGTAFNNYKIVPSVASNNLTVALKTLAGNDPSANNPIYVRIGDEIKTITGALSSTLNAGSNYFNSGSAELATKEVDYFVYVGYSVTSSSMFIGFARIPYANLLSDFVDSTTSEKLFSEFVGSLQSTSASKITVIGRFGATLSAGAGYTWSVPTFTVNNLIQRPIYETRWLNAVATPTGLSATTGSDMNYQITSRILNFVCYVEGTSNSTSFSAKVPMACGSFTGTNYFGGSSLYAQDNGSVLTVASRWSITETETSITFYKTFNAATTWTGSGSKTVYASGNYGL